MIFQYYVVLNDGDGIITDNGCIDWYSNNILCITQKIRQKTFELHFKSETCTFLLLYVRYGICPLQRLLLRGSFFAAITLIIKESLSHLNMNSQIF